MKNDPIDEGFNGIGERFEVGVDGMAGAKSFRIIVKAMGGRSERFGN